MMELRAAIFFLFLYYIRPQDWISGMEGFNIVRPMILAWILTLFASRDRRAATKFFVTPHDWLMLVYLVYVVWNAPDPKEAIMGFLPLVLFYGLTVQSLSRWEDVLTYLKAWNIMLLGIAGIAVASLYGMDFTGAAELTEQNRGRLCIGTWLHDNPNALGHSVIVVLPLSYMLYFWKGSLMGRLVIFPAQAALAIYCTLRTESKGSFVVGGLLFVLIYVIGRPLLVRLFALALAATVGVSALATLPRMSEMGRLRADEAVQGRLMAWDQARMVVKNHDTGVGWKQFTAFITWERETFEKATHSSYVKVSADLGIYGLAIYLASLWAAFRSTTSLHRLTRKDDLQERCRRILILILSAYATSSWMINREYHTEYFLIVAVAGAIHRLGLRAEADQVAEAELEIDEAEQQSAEVLPVPSGAGLVHEQALPHLEKQGGDMDPLAEAPSRHLWAKLGLLDFAACAGLTWSVLYVWDYILKTLYAA